jgi:hypothetical protein
MVRFVQREAAVRGQGDTSMPRRVGAGALGLVLCLLGAGAAGCGGSSTLTHAQLVSKANAICRAKNAQVSALGKPTTLSGLQHALAVGIPIAQQAENQLRALKPPSSDAALFRDTLSLDAQALTVDRQAEQAAGAGKATSFRQLLQQATTISTQARSKASQLGLTDCAQG